MTLAASNPGYVPPGITRHHVIEAPALFTVTGSWPSVKSRSRRAAVEVPELRPHEKSKVNSTSQSSRPQIVKSVSKKPAQGLQTLNINERSLAGRVTPAGSLQVQENRFHARASWSYKATTSPAKRLRTKSPDHDSKGTPLSFDDPAESQQLADEPHDGDSDGDSQEAERLTRSTGSTLQKPQKGQTVLPYKGNKSLQPRATATKFCPLAPGLTFFYQSRRRQQIVQMSRRSAAS